MQAGPDTSRWSQMKSEERARAYSPSTMLDGELAPYIRAYVDQSAAAYAAIGKVHTLAYGTKTSQTLDLAHPDVEAPVPLHVFIHGGYWQELSKKESFFAAPETLAQGIAFAAVDYTLAPNATLGEITAEVVAALRYLRAQAAAFGIDPTRIVVSGSSAGAHLAAMACLLMERPEQPAGLILLSGIYDLRALLGTYVNDALGLDQESASRNSPSLCEISDFPSTLIAWAEKDTDEFKRQSRQFAQHLAAAGNPVTTLEVAARNHFDIVHDLANDTALGAWLGRLANA